MLWPRYLPGLLFSLTSRGLVTFDEARVASEPYVAR
jgi:hypothetical protein